MKKIFFNGTIITLEGDELSQSVLVEDGIIKKVGSNAEILADNEDAEPIDLRGKTMLPAFIDAHSHLSSYANSFLQAPLEEAGSFSDIIERLSLFAKKNDIQPGQWMIAGGYDHNVLLEKAHPTRQLLDQHFSGIAVVLQHKSGHFGIFNSTALAAIHMQNQYPDGYLEESDFVEAITLSLAATKSFLMVHRREKQHG